MNGISCPPKSNPFYNKEKEEKAIKKLKFRFVIVLIFSHMLIFIINNPMSDEVKKIPSKFSPPNNYKAIKIPLVVHFPFNKKVQEAVILNNAKKLMTAKVYVLKKNNETETRHIVYMNEKDIGKFVSSKSKLFHAYPKSMILTTTKKENHSYEINF